MKDAAIGVLERGISLLLDGRHGLLVDVDQRRRLRSCGLALRLASVLQETAPRLSFARTQRLALRKGGINLQDNREHALPTPFLRCAGRACPHSLGAAGGPSAPTKKLQNVMAVTEALSQFWQTAHVEGQNTD